MAVATDLSSRAFSALGPFASKEFRSRPSCAISLRGTVVVNAAVLCAETLGIMCVCDGRRWTGACVCTLARRTSYFSVLLPAYTAFDHESWTCSPHGQRSTSCRFKANRRDISLPWHSFRSLASPLEMLYMLVPLIIFVSRFSWLIRIYIHD